MNGPQDTKVKLGYLTYTNSKQLNNPQKWDVFNKIPYDKTLGAWFEISSLILEHLFEK